MNYYEKYIKYKNKYILLKTQDNIQLGGDNFLTKINLSGLSNLQTIGNNFLSKCERLTSIKCNLKQEEIFKNGLQKELLDTITYQ